MRKSPLRTRFMRMVRVREQDDCWEWTGVRDKDGYGIFRANGHNYRSHAVSLLVFEKHILDLLWPECDGVGAAMVLHRCDHPWCVNPDHLYAGDAKQNMQDCRDCGRMLVGASARERKIRLNPTSVKMTDAFVEEIRHRVARGELQKALAREFGISRAQVSRIVNGKRWMP